MVVIAGHPRRRQQRQPQLHHHEKTHRAEGAEGRRPAGAAPKPCRLSQWPVPQSKPQHYRRRSQQIRQQHRRLRSGQNALRIHPAGEQRCSGGGDGGIDDARQKLDHQKEQQIQQGLAQCGQNALRGIGAYVLHTNTSFPHKDNIPAPHRPPTSGCTGPKRRNLKLSGRRKEGRTPRPPLCLVSCDQIFTSHCILITALPPTRTFTAPSCSYRRLRISEGRFMCSPCKKTFSCPGCTMSRRYR